jgi:hypothetical protein
MLAAVAVPAVATAKDTPAVAAAQFLAHEFTRLGDVYPSPTSPGNNDAGLMADALLGMHAAGVATPVQRRATAALRRNYFNATIVASGTLGKDLIVATEQGVDPRHWGTDSAGANIDLIARLRAAQADSGGFTDTSASGATTTSNVFSQALALIGEHRAGIGNPSAVAMLVRQQCPGGGFRLTVPKGEDGQTCGSDDQVSADTTAMGVWALTEVGGHATQVARAVHWLRSQQDPATGAFGTDPARPSQVNANSTGLAAMALARGGDSTAAARANGWLVGMQLPATTPVAAMAGAVVRGQGDLDAIDADPTAFWLKSSGADNLGKQDALRRATAQAVLGLAAATATAPPSQPAGHAPSHRPGRTDASTGGGSGHRPAGSTGNATADPPGRAPGAGRTARSAGPSGFATPEGFAVPERSATRSTTMRAAASHGSFFGSTAGIVTSALAGLLVAAAVALLLLRRRRSP